jgi:hypothetical protein
MNGKHDLEFRGCWRNAAFMNGSSSNEKCGQICDEMS